MPLVCLLLVFTVFIYLFQFAPAPATLTVILVVRRASLNLLPSFSPALSHISSVHYLGLLLSTIIQPIPISPLSIDWQWFSVKHHEDPFRPFFLPTNAVCNSLHSLLPLYSLHTC